MGQYDALLRPLEIKGVRIRNRNPCTRARRRLFGWKVRLPLATALATSTEKLSTRVLGMLSIHSAMILCALQS